MTRNPRELVIETILEGYRHEHRSSPTGTTPSRSSTPTCSPSSSPGPARRQAARQRADVAHLAYLAMTLVSEGARHWAAGAFGDRSFADVVTADICTLINGSSRTTTRTEGGHMAWDFETDPEFQELLDWADAFVRDEVEPLDLIWPHLQFTPLDATRRKVIDPLKEQVRAKGLVGHPSRARARRPGLRAAEAGAAQRDPRPVAVGADRLRLPGPRHRQRRDHRALRHAGAEGALPAAAAGRRTVLQLLDDRAAGRRRPHPVQDAARCATATTGSSTAGSTSPPTPRPRRSSSSWW